MATAKENFKKRAAMANKRIEPLPAAKKAEKTKPLPRGTQTASEYFKEIKSRVSRGHKWHKMKRRDI